MINIELLDVMGDDRTVVNAARVSFNKQTETMRPQDDKLIRYLAEHKHWTPFRHPQISIRVKAPIFLARQLVKHQVGLSWNEVSRRYVDDDPTFFWPDEWRKKPDGFVKQGSGEPFSHVQSIVLDDLYDSVIACCSDAYHKMLDYGVAPEMARMCLPVSMMTEWIWSGSLLAFAHVFNERSAEGAQAEAREFAYKLDAVIYPLFHTSWEVLTR